MQQLMVVAMAADLVARRGDLCDQLRRSLGDPTKAEERRLRIAPREQVEQTLRRVDAAQFERVPVRPANRVRHVENLEPVLVVNRKRAV